MSGYTEVRVEVDSSKIQSLMDGIERQGRSLPLKRLAVIGVRSVLRNFREEGRPQRWEPLQYPPGHRREDGKILQDTGHLMRSVDFYTFRRTNIAITAGDRLDYAAPHQYGWKERNIPARPFMMWQGEDVTKIEETLADHLAKGAR